MYIQIGPDIMKALNLLLKKNKNFGISDKNQWSLALSNNNIFHTNLGKISLPCCIRDPIVSHIEFINVKLFSSSSGFGLQGCGLIHSPGATLKRK